LQVSEWEIDYEVTGGADEEGWQYAIVSIFSNDNI